MKTINTLYLRPAIILSLFCALFIFIYAFALGKANSFLYLNADLGAAADTFFKIITNAGDGLIWLAALLILIFVLKRKDGIVFFIFTFVFNTVITQVFKYLIVPDTPRPIKFIADTSAIHLVPGVTVHSISSFPSGHTATIFCLYLLFSMFINQRWWLSVGLLISLIVAYSRIYLAQHFPQDIGGGILTAIAAVVLTYIILQNIYKRKLHSS